MKSPTNLTFEVICKLGVQEVPGAVRKLILIGLLTTGIGLLFATLILITEEVMTFRRTLVKDLKIQAEIIGSNSTAALSFQDQKNAEEILSAHIACRMGYSVLYTKAAQMFRYLNGGRRTIAGKRESNGIPLSTFSSSMTLD